MRRVSFIDSTGINNLSALIETSREERIHLILSGVNQTVRKTLQDCNINEIIDQADVCPDIHTALKRAEFILKEPTNQDS